ncbi:MAG: hypothetical protein OEM38_10695 [Gammaproteobacteria bacterium]|nr:hypothetical protein [Gammaproteobacteria bacterium]
MKITRVIILFWMCIPSSFANDAVEAVAAVLDVAIKEHIDSSQVEVGLGTAVMTSQISPELHLGVNNYFLQRYKMGIAVDVPIPGNSDTPNINIGVIAGVKKFNPLLGRHFYNLTLGASMFDNFNGLYIEPSISFRLKESSAVKYFWIMHTFGVNASVAYRRTVVESQLDSSPNANAVLFRVNVFMGQRGRKY